MPTYRATIRHGKPQRYHVEDIDAPDIAEAMRLLSERFPPNVTGADLVEVRLAVDPEQRDYVPG